MSEELNCKMESLQGRYRQELGRGLALIVAQSFLCYGCFDHWNAYPNPGENSTFFLQSLNLSLAWVTQSLIMAITISIWRTRRSLEKRFHACSGDISGDKQRDNVYLIAYSLKNESSSQLTGLTVLSQLIFAAHVITVFNHPLP